MKTALIGLLLLMTTVLPALADELKTAAAPVEGMHEQARELVAQHEPHDDDSMEAERDKKFYSWEGAEAGPVKRKFYSWAGKRSDNQMRELDMDKRKMYSWAGKRADSAEDSSAGSGESGSAENRGKRGKYRRSHYAGARRSGMHDLGKRKFYSWAGKRADDSDMPEMEKRKFYSWAGKRSAPPMEADKRKFYSWAG